MKSVFFYNCFISWAFFLFQFAQLWSGFSRWNSSRVFAQSKRLEDYQINVAVFLCWSADFISAPFHSDRLKAHRALQRLMDRRLRNHKAESLTQFPLGSCHSNTGEEQALYLQRLPPSDPCGVWKPSWITFQLKKQSQSQSALLICCLMSNFLLFDILIFRNVNEYWSLTRKAAI